MSRDAYEALAKYDESGRRPICFELATVVTMIDAIPYPAVRRLLIDKCRKAMDAEDEVESTDT